MYDISAEGFMYFPYKSADSKNIIFTLWGLGTAKFVLDKDAESRKYLQLCLRCHAEDEQAVSWQADASNYLRLLDRKAIQITLRARSVLPSLMNQLLLTVEGDILEWGSYAKPTQKEFIVQLTDQNVDMLEAKGFHNPNSLEGHTLVLLSDESGDLRRPTQLLRVV